MPNLNIHETGLAEPVTPGPRLLVFGGEAGVGDGPVVQNLFPDLPGPVSPGSILGFDVITSDGSTIALLTVSLGFDGFQVEEVVFDGNAFVGPYQSGTISEIDGGFQLRFQRAGGMPGSPRMKVRAVSSLGGINA